MKAAVLTGVRGKSGSAKNTRTTTSNDFNSSLSLNQHKINTTFSLKYLYRYAFNHFILQQI